MPKKRRSELKRLEVLLLAGLHSGSPIEMNDDYFRRKKGRLRALHRQRRLYT